MKEYNPIKEAKKNSPFSYKYALPTQIALFMVIMALVIMNWLSSIPISISENHSFGSFTDSRDGKKYKTIAIGKQTWMAENLDYSGSNNDIGMCYNKKPENCEKYGALYSWEEAMKVCPKDWHLPDSAEWQALLDFVGGDSIAGKKLKSKGGWSEWECKYKTESTSGRGNTTVVEHDKCNANEYGFTALPGGGTTLRSSSCFSYNQSGTVGKEGLWWSATETWNGFDNKHSAAYIQHMSYNSEYVGIRYPNNGGYVNWEKSCKSSLLSVRCVQD